MRPVLADVVLTAAGPTAVNRVDLKRLGENVVVARSDPWATNVVGIRTAAGIVVVEQSWRCAGHPEPKGP